MAATAAEASSIAATVPLCAMRSSETAARSPETAAEPSGRDAHKKLASSQPSAFRLTEKKFQLHKEQQIRYR